MTPSNNIYESSYWCLRTDGNKTPSVKTSNSQESKYTYNINYQKMMSIKLWKSINSQKNMNGYITTNEDYS